MTLLTNPALALRPGILGVDVCRPELDYPASDGLTIGDTNMVNAKQPPWSLAESGAADLFRPIPFGVDQRSIYSPVARYPYSVRPAPPSATLTV